MNVRYCYYNVLFWLAILPARPNPATQSAWVAHPVGAALGTATRAMLLGRVGDNAWAPTSMASKLSLVYLYGESMNESESASLSRVLRRILVVEDDATLAYGLKLNLEVDGHVVLVEGNGEAALSIPDVFRPDLVILDIMLPGIDGLELLRRWRRSGISTRVIVLSARGESDDRVRGLRLGADDYMTKPFHLPELLARVARQLDRVESSAVESGRMVAVGCAQVDMSAHTVIRGTEEQPLPPKEYALFTALLSAHGAAVAKQDLLKTVWGHKAAVKTNTVEYHVAGLRRKIELNPRIPKHILTVSRFGYRLQL